METVNIHHAKTHLSSIIGKVEQGGEFVIARNGCPVAQLTPIPQKPDRIPGKFIGKIKIAEDWNAPISASEMSELLDGHPTDPLKL